MMLVYLRDVAEGKRGMGLLLLVQLSIETNEILKHMISYI